MWVTTKPEESVGSPAAGVTRSCELSNVWAED